MVRFLSITLGVLFLAAGLAKLFVLDAFASTIAGIVFIPIQAGIILAAIVICVEAAGAIALLVNFQVRLVSLLFCLVVAVFLWVLSSAIIQGTEITCNCFGILGIHLTNRQELLLDFALFNAFGLLAYAAHGMEDPSPAEHRGRGRTFTIALVVVLAVLELSLAKYVLDRGRYLSPEDSAIALRHVESMDSLFAARSNTTRALLLVRFRDMNCPPCSDDFFHLVDSLRSRVGVNSHRVAALVAMEPSLMANSPKMLERWIEANGFRFPVFVMPEAVSDSISLAKSTAVVIGARDRILFSERFPMGLTKRLVALGWFRS